MPSRITACRVGFDQPLVISLGDSSARAAFSFAASMSRGLRIPQVSAIDSCIREPPGRLQCARVQEPLDDYNK